MNDKVSFTAHNLFCSVVADRLMLWTHAIYSVIRQFFFFLLQNVPENLDRTDKMDVDF